MASLIPDTNYTPNTTAASNAYVAAQSAFSDALMKPVGLLSKMYTDEYDRKMAADKLALEQKRWDITNARAEDQAAREKDKYNRELLKETATSEAMQATLDPNRYSQGKILGEQRAAEAGIANLSPEEQVVARQQIAANYDPKLSGQQWLTGATSATNVDQGKLFDTKTKMYEVAVNTPGTSEYEAKVKASKELKQWELDLAHKNKLSEIAAGKTPEKEKTITMSKKMEDGSVQEVQVLSSQVPVVAKQGFDLGTWKNVPNKDANGGKGIYGQKDIDTMLTKVAGWNIFSGDKDSAMSDVSKTKTRLESYTKDVNGKSTRLFTDKEVNNMLGSALNVAVSDDSYDSGRFQEVINSSVGDKPTGKKDSGILGSKTTEVPTITTTAVTNKPVSSGLTKEEQSIIDMIPKSSYTVNGVMNLNVRDSLIRKYLDEQERKTGIQGINSYMKNQGSSQGLLQDYLNQDNQITRDVIAR